MAPASRSVRGTPFDRLRTGFDGLRANGNRETWRSRTSRSVGDPSPGSERTDEGLDFGEGFEALGHFFDVHDVGVFVVHVEQVDLVREQAAVVGALLDEDDVEAVGVGVGD